ncbi:MAG: hypothetical protein H5T50_01440 [Nitrososphaeria archaeon]|nr:hypothetical protein [Nitrososphaeria archaeon]
MKTLKHVIKWFLIIAFFLLAWAPWLDNEKVHDMVLEERGWRDGTIVPIEKVVADEEALKEMIEYSRAHGVEDGILICDYNVYWFPFGRWVASCEGGYYVTFYGQIIP